MTGTLSSQFCQLGMLVIPTEVAPSATQLSSGLSVYYAHQSQLEEIWAERICEVEVPDRSMPIPAETRRMSHRVDDAIRPVPAYPKVTCRLLASPIS
jgi:hypothetical protein